MTKENKKNKLTPKQELFTRNLFKGMTQREAWIQAGYSSKYPLADIDTHACHLANKDKIQTRLTELNAKLEDAAIMDKQELLKTHTEIARGRVGHILDEGNRIKQDANKDDASIQELESIDVTIGKGENAKLATVTKLKLHDPVRSMQEIAKLRGYYPKDGTGEGNTYIVNIEQAVIDAGNRFESVFTRLAEKVKDAPA